MHRALATWTGSVIALLLCGPGPAPADGRAGPACFRTSPTIVGTSGPDELRGTPRRDVIVGLGGDDVIHGRRGEDLVCGGRGDDSLFGGEGRDRLEGDRGDDTFVDRLAATIVKDMSGASTVRLGPGDDYVELYRWAEVRTGDGHDVVYVHRGVVHTGPGGDWVRSTVVDTDARTRLKLHLGPGTDVVDMPGHRADIVARGQRGADRLRTGRADDVLYGGSGRDFANAGAGADRCYRVEVRVDC